jgi:branched-subunit amino acid transport protein
VSGEWQTALTIAGLALVTLVSRCFFLFPEREVPLPGWLKRDLQPRLPGVAAATLYYLWRPGVLGPLLAGLALFLPLRLVLGW